MNKITHCGFVAIIGRSNVGKSTLLNAILGQKLCITSRRLQTTRHKIMGVKTQAENQIVFIDTPGLQQNAKRQLNKTMNRIAQSTWDDADIIAWVVDISTWKDEDEWLLQQLHDCKKPVILLVNKVDLIKQKPILLPKLQQLSTKMTFSQVIPISAQHGDNLQAFEQQLMTLLPESPHFFAADQITDRNENFIIAEIIREKILRLLSQEVPHATAVIVESIKEIGNCRHIEAIIWVERSGQKAIVIGKGGEKLKEIGRRARLTLESRYQQAVMLKLWVRVKESWSADKNALQQLEITTT